MRNFLLGVGATTVAFLLTFIVCLILAFPTMWLWNWLMPAIFGLGRITVWMALGINLLSAILFKSKTRVNKKD
ncbi:MAG: hypothetical protein J6X18_00740 [Bacteroidales bacterium]|nr:hypothetical protein [Bacteroidales bacterium]